MNAWVWEGRNGGLAAHFVIDQRDAEDVREEKDDFVLCALARGGAYITLDAGDPLDLACATV